MAAGDTEAVVALSGWQDRKGTKHPYPVSASKYCHFSEPGKFAIYDSKAHKALAYILCHSEKALAEPREWQTAVLQLLQNLELPKEFARIDRYLWLLGYAIDSYAPDGKIPGARPDKAHRRSGVPQLLWQYWDECRALMPGGD
jgi:hypothetical protein